jgi:hypothetical protein
MNSASEFLTVVDSIDKVSTRFRPKTNETVEKAKLLGELFVRATAADKQAAHELITQSNSMKLLAISAFCSEAAVNQKDPSLLRAAVLLHILEGFSRDYRDNYRYLVLVADASKRLEVDFSKLVASLNHLGSEHSKKSLDDFVNRDSSLNILWGESTNHRRYISIRPVLTRRVSFKSLKELIAFSRGVKS